MTKKVLTTIAMIAAMGFSVQTWACGIEGMVTWSDGSKSDGTSKISTSWNSKKAYPKKGRYYLDLGSSACGNKVTVYVNGNQGKRVTVTGSTVVNFTLR